MTNNTTKTDSSQPAPETAAHLFDNWFDPIEAGLRDRVHEFLHAMFDPATAPRSLLRTDFVAFARKALPERIHPA